MVSKSNFPLSMRKLPKHCLLFNNDDISYYFVLAGGEHKISSTV